MPTVLVTGAGRGLGLEFARQYAADGWRVIATVRDVKKAKDLADDVLLFEHHAGPAALGELTVFATSPM